MTKNLLTLPFHKYAAPVSAILAAILTTGCCSTVAKSGDAKILTCWQLMHSEGMEMFYMKLPSINLASSGTNTLTVRDLPIYLAGQFKYSISMQVPLTELTSEALAPWKDTKITLIFRKLDGSEAYRQAMILGTSPHGLPRRESRHLEWEIGDGHSILISDPSYDIVIVVEHASLRQMDRISLYGYAYCHKP